MPRVVLFKTPTTTNGSDSYQESFTRAGCGVTYIPVLQETFHLDQLTRIILDGNPTWGGIVITSKRGAEAWIQAASTSEEDHSSWNDIQLYTVGSSSLDYLSSIAHTLAKTRQLDTTRAIQAKSATALLPLIVENTGTSTGPLLLIRGDKSTNELQNGLRQAKREYIETIVYATTCRHSLEDDIKTLLDTVRGEGQDGDDIWLAFFSPSSAEMVLEYMRSHTENGGTGGTKEGIWSKVKIGAIGETTAQFLQDRNLEVEAVAKEPTADGMASAVQACSREL